MKRNENRKNRNWRNFAVLTLVCMLAATLVGCKTSTAVTPEPSTSEVVSESVSESVSEEPSEVVSEEVSEEPEIVDGVQMVYYESYEELCVYCENLEEPVIAVLDSDEPEKGQAILYDGAHYTIEEESAITVKTPEVISSMYSTASHIGYVDYDYNGSHEWDISIEKTGTDMEIPLIITYEDGTTDTITVYITKEWKYSWEE